MLKQVIHSSLVKDLEAYLEGKGKEGGREGGEGEGLGKGEAARLSFKLCETFWPGFFFFSLFLFFLFFSFLIFLFLQVLSQSFFLATTKSLFV